MSGKGRKLVAALAVGLGLSVAQAQTPPANAIEQAEQQRRTSETKLSSEVAEVLRTAPNQAKSAPEKAVRNLKDVRTKVDIAAISTTKRDELVKQLDAAIDAIQKGGTTTVTSKAKDDPAVTDRVVRDEKNRKVVEASRVEAKEVNEAISGISADLDKGRTADAKRKLADIAAKYPDNPSVLYLQGQQTNADAVAVARDYAQEASKRHLKVQNDLMASALPPLSDLEFDKGYRDRIDRRIKLNAPKLTAEEKKLLASLDTPIKGGLNNAPFQEAVQLLSTAIDQKIYVDTKSLEARGVNLDDKVDVPGGVSARSALRVMLQSKGLTFVLRENLIQVVTLEEAKKQCVARAYDVRDLVSGGALVGNVGPWGAYMDYQAVAANAQIIIDAIKKGVEPAAWDTGGGVGSITFHYGTMSIIVRAPSEVHADLYRKMSK